MLGALFTVHLPQGYMASEFVIALLIMSIAVAISYNWEKCFQLYEFLRVYQSNVIHL